MTQEIQRSFRELLNKTTWIDDETKYLATEKVNAMSLKIGYPDFILQPYLLNERYKDVIKCFYTNKLKYIYHIKLAGNYNRKESLIHINSSINADSNPIG